MKIPALLAIPVLSTLAKPQGFYSIERTRQAETTIAYHPLGNTPDLTDLA